MKKTILIALLLIGAGCNKQRCWNCKMHTFKDGDLGAAKVDTIIVCDKTEKQIRDFENDKTEIIISGGKMVKTDAICTE